jgi:hypothetical protein
MLLSNLVTAVCLLFAPLDAPAPGEVEASLSPTQFVRGGPAQELRVFGTRLALVGLEIKPATGITLGEMKVREPLPEDGLFRPHGVKVWMVPLLIDAAAEPGERTVVAVTPQGRSAEMKFKVVTHAPDIADLRIVEARPDGTEFTVLAKGIGADFGGDKGSLLASFECGGGFSVSRCTVSKVVAKGSAIEVHASTRPFGPENVLGTCKFGVTLYDKAGTSSNQLTATVEYKW